MRVQALPILLGCVSTLVVASPGSPSTETRIKSTLEERFAGHRIEAVHVSSFPGLYEVVTPDEMLYTDSQGATLFIGKVVDTKTHEDLTAKRWNELHSVDFSALPFKQAIKTVRGDGSRLVAVFADPNCPFCQKLEQNIQGLTNVTIYTFLFPLEDTHPGASARARAIWCSSDPSASWSQWMNQQVEPAAAAACESDPIAPLHELGNKLDINMTPTLFFSDGHRAAGVLSQSEFESHLQGDARQAKR